MTANAAAVKSLACARLAGPGNVRLHEVDARRRRTEMIQALLAEYRETLVAAGADPASASLDSGALIATVTRLYAIQTSGGFTAELALVTLRDWAADGDLDPQVVEALARQVASDAA